MTEDEAQDHRRARLREWLREQGGLTRVSESRRLKPSYTSYLSQISNGYSFGSRSARNCEVRLGMPNGWLDLPTTTDVPTPQPVSVPPPTLAQALEVVGLALAEDMPHDVREDVADALAKLARRSGTARDQTQVLQLLQGPHGKAQAQAA